MDSPEQQQLSVAQIPATIGIALINLIVFSLAEAQGSTENTDILIRFGASERTLVWQGEYWRLVTPMFLHIGWSHFIWNTLFMFMPNATVERALGSGRFLLAYLATGVAATACSLLAHDVVAAGASGAGFGIIGVLLVLTFRRLGSWRAFLSDPPTKQNLFLIGLWLLIGFSGAFNMDNYAHLGGLIFGLLLGWIMTTELRRAPPWRLGLPLAFGLLWLATVAAAAYPWPGRSSPLAGFRAAVAGGEALEKKDLASAIALFNEAEALGYSDFALFYNRGLAYLWQKDYDRASADFTRAIQLNPRSREAQTGRSLARQGQDDPNWADDLPAKP